MGLLEEIDTLLSQSGRLPPAPLEALSKEVDPMPGDLMWCVALVACRMTTIAAVATSVAVCVVVTGWLRISVANRVGLLQSTVLLGDGGGGGDSCSTTVLYLRFRLCLHVLGFRRSRCLGLHCTPLCPVKSSSPSQLPSQQVWT